MKVNKNAGRVFLFNIIMTGIGYSRGLKCFTKTIYTNPEGKEIIIGSDGEVGSDGQSIECEGQPFCATLSGSFNDGANAYEVESIRMCADPCDETRPPSPTLLRMVLEVVDTNLQFSEETTAGSTPVTLKCCADNNCNEPPETTTTTTTTTSSGYSIHKITFNSIVSLLAVAGICFF